MLEMREGADISKPRGGAAGIPVVVAADDNYAETLAVCMYSILEHTTAFIDFTILDGGIQDGNKGKIALALSGFTHYSIRYVDMAGYDLARFPALQHYGITTFARYFIPEICADCGKVVYTDSDVVFTQDIATYYATDMEGYGVAATPDEFGAEKIGPGNAAKRKQMFKIPADHLYFAAGNMLIDCDYWRRNNITEKLVQLTVELYDILVCPDLDVLNIAFANAYKRMPYTHCCCVHREESTCGHGEMEAGFRAPFIIHYSGPVKPWNSADVIFADYYHSILAKTGFRKGVQGGGKAHAKYLLKKLLRSLSTMRVCISTDGDVAEGLELAETGGMDLLMAEPAAQGTYTLTGANPAYTLKLRALKDVKVRFSFSPLPVRDAGGHLPLHTEYRGICLDGEPVPGLPASTMADTPFQYEKELGQGDTLSLHVSQRPYRYKLAEIRDILRRRYPAPFHFEIPRHKGLLAMALYGLLRLKRFRDR